VRVELVSPEQVLYEGEAEMVVVRTLGGGDIAFQNNHAAFLAALDVWPAKLFMEDGSTILFAVHGGFVEVSNNRVTILSDVAELADQIDLERAQEALADAEARLQADPDDDHAIAQKKRAIARLDVCGVAAGQASAAAH
jgi:F-type H+-transporting ATPase subunit epsilon